MNVKTKAITAMKMQTVQTLMAPSIVAVILDFLEMDSHAQVSNSKKFYMKQNVRLNTVWNC